MNLLALGFSFLFAILMIGFWFMYRHRSNTNLRDIPTYYKLLGAIELAVEDGSRVHLSLGRGDISGPQAAAALVGLSMLNRISLVAANSDLPPVTSSGDGALAILTQDTLRNTYQSMGMIGDYNPSLARVSGLTPFSYAAGTIPIILDEGVTANILIGNFSHEVALISTAGDSKKRHTFAGADSVTAQAVLYATADEYLIGEELFAGGAYLGAGPSHVASLHAQDVIRWVIVAAIIIGALGELLDFF